MLPAFVIVSREGLEMFLIVAITAAYLRKTNQTSLLSAVYVGILGSILASALVGYLLTEVANVALWEGILGLMAVVMVASLVIHMWKVGPKFKQQMEARLSDASLGKSSTAAWWGVLLFTLLMITREGMETALMLFQVRQTGFAIGTFLGLAMAAAIALLWKRVGHRVNLRHFFQVTGVFLLLFLIQISIYAFHELCEAGIFPQSDAWHEATEPFSPDGKYGKWFSLFMVAGTGIWLAVLAWKDAQDKRKNISVVQNEALRLAPIVKEKERTLA